MPTLFLPQRTAALTVATVACGSVIWALAVARAAGAAEVSAVVTGGLCIALALVGVFERSTASALGGIMIGSVLLGMLSGASPHLRDCLTPVSPKDAYFPFDTEACTTALRAGGWVGAGLGGALATAVAVVRGSPRGSVTYADEALCGRGALWATLLAGGALIAGSIDLAHAAAALAGLHLWLPLRSAREGRRWLDHVYAGVAQGYELRAPADLTQLATLPLLTPRARATEVDLVLWYTGCHDPYRSRRGAVPIARVAPELGSELRPLRTCTALCWLSGALLLTIVGWSIQLG